MKFGPRLRMLLFVALAVVGTAATAVAQTVPDPVALNVVDTGHGKVRLTVTAGESGAPYGFTVCWMKSSDFAAAGSVWPILWTRQEGWGDFTGTPTLNNWGDLAQTFTLASGEALDIEVGDLRDETGVSGTTSNELLDATDYVFAAYALGPAGSDLSAHGALSPNCAGLTTPQGHNCTYTQGYWKNHTSEWPTTSMQLGSVSYSAAQLQAILTKAPAGNGLITLAHQLIAAKLNLAHGSDPSAISGSIATADALIGARVVPPVGTGALSPGMVTTLTQNLDDYNNGLRGPGHCGLTPTRASTWGFVKASYR